MSFNDNNEMWKHSEIMRTFVENYLDQLEPAKDGAIIEASVEDIIEPEIPLAYIPDQMSFINVRSHSASLIANLNKIAEKASKYNNEKVSYAIEQAIAEIKIISGLDQE